MAKDPFLLVNLGENESKTLAQVISNDTARKILDLLSKRETATESDVAKALSVPLSTVHYNLQALVKANLVQAEEFHYSQKGKEILHYSLANKLIIIAPKTMDSQSFKDKLKSILPVAAIGVAAAIVLEVGALLSNRSFSTAAAPGMMRSAPQDMMIKAAPDMAAGAAEATGLAQPAAFALDPVVALWFLLGVGFTVVVMALWFYFQGRKKKQ